MVGAQQTGRKMRLVLPPPVLPSRMEKLAVPLLANAEAEMTRRFRPVVLVLNPPQMFVEQVLEPPQTMVTPALSRPPVRHRVEVAFRPGLAKYTRKMPLPWVAAMPLLVLLRLLTMLPDDVDGASLKMPLEPALVEMVM